MTEGVRLGFYMNFAQGTCVFPNHVKRLQTQLTV